MERCRSADRDRPLFRGDSTDDLVPSSTSSNSDAKVSSFNCHTSRADCVTVNLEASTSPRISFNMNMGPGLYQLKTRAEDALCAFATVLDSTCARLGLTPAIRKFQEILGSSHPGGFTADTISVCSSKYGQTKVRVLSKTKKGSRVVNSRLQMFWMVALLAFTVLSWTFVALYFGPIEAASSAPNSSRDLPVTWTLPNGVTMRKADPAAQVKALRDQLKGTSSMYQEELAAHRHTLALQQQLKDQVKTLQSQLHKQNKADQKKLFSADKKLVEVQAVTSGLRSRKLNGLVTGGQKAKA